MLVSYMYKRKFSFEIKRKILHLSSIVFPILYYRVNRITIIVIILFFFLTSVTIDVSRYIVNKIIVNKIQVLTKRVFDNIMRVEEKENFRLTGATYMMMGMFFTALLFDKPIAITSWLILIIADSAAALLGKKFGKKTVFKKSLLGSIVFFFSSLIIVYISSYVFNFSISLLYIIICCLITTIFEFFSDYLRINDNLSIPLVFSLCFPFSINYL